MRSRFENSSRRAAAAGQLTPWRWRRSGSRSKRRRGKLGTREDKYRRVERISFFWYNGRIQSVRPNPARVCAQAWSIKPVTAKEPIVRFAVTGHVPKGAWVAERSSPCGGLFVFFSHAFPSTPITSRRSRSASHRVTTLRPSPRCSMCSGRISNGKDLRPSVMMCG